MSALQAAWESLLEAIDASGISPAHVDHATMALLQLAPFSTPEEVSALLDQAADVVRNGSLPAAAAIAMSVGALVEQGAPGEPLANALIARLPEVLKAAASYADAVEALEVPTEGEEIAGDWVGDRFAPEDWVRARYQSHPDEVVAWHELRRFCLPMIAAATRNRLLLERFAIRPMGSALERLRHLEPHARFLYRLHEILLDSPLRFVDLPSRRVFDLRIDAVATNFELHSLLLATLAEPLGLQGPSPAIIACLGGHGPRQLLEKSESAWALYSYRAVPDLLEGRKAPMDAWVWNEAIPSDIPEHDGTRVVVATEAHFIRDWETGRTFGAMGGTVDLVTELPAAEAARFVVEISR